MREVAGRRCERLAETRSHAFGQGLEKEQNGQPRPSTPADARKRARCAVEASKSSRLAVLTVLSSAVDPVRLFFSFAALGSALCLIPVFADWQLLTRQGRSSS
jgi:hypothetical protein